RAGGTAHSIGAVTRTAVTTLRTRVPLGYTGEDTRPIGTGLIRSTGLATTPTVVGVGIGVHTASTTAGCTGRADITAAPTIVGVGLRVHAGSTARHLTRWTRLTVPAHAELT
ncbi:MAG: hypothetical protein OIN85_07815, partial [Candidatus Methanoperedens sp.]|nr:hypothetical protein [Candidatus Methanoperedens sp.]